MSFQRLRADGSLYGQLADAIDSAVKAGHLDRPKRGQVRACKPTRPPTRPTTGARPPRHPQPLHRPRRGHPRDQARDTCGLEFTRLRADGHIVTGLRSAINSAIRAKLITRVDATWPAPPPPPTARPPSSPTIFDGATRANQDQPMNNRRNPHGKLATRRSDARLADLAGCAALAGCKRQAQNGGQQRTPPRQTRTTTTPSIASRVCAPPTGTASSMRPCAAYSVHPGTGRSAKIWHGLHQ